MNKVEEMTFKKIMAEYFPELIKATKDMKDQNWETQPNKINKKETHTKNHCNESVAHQRQREDLKYPERKDNYC